MIKTDIAKCYLRWSEIDRLVNTLCDKISNSKIEFKDIYGIPRGGLVPAVMVSHKLKIPMTKGTISPDTLIIDDISDSGETFRQFYNRYQTEYSFPFDLKFASLHYKPHTSGFEPYFYANEWTSDDWIVYPWEGMDSKPIQDYKI